MPPSSVLPTILFPSGAGFPRVARVYIPLGRSVLKKKLSDRPSIHPSIHPSGKSNRFTFVFPPNFWNRPTFFYWISLLFLKSTKIFLLDFSSKLKVFWNLPTFSRDISSKIEGNFSSLHTFLKEFTYFTLVLCTHF